MHTERVTFLTTPRVKAALASRAAALGISAGEYIRRRVEEDQSFSPEQEAEFAALVEQVNVAVPKMEASLDEMSRVLRETHDHVDQLLRKMGARA